MSILDGILLWALAERLWRALTCVSSRVHSDACRLVKIRIPDLSVIAKTGNISGDSGSRGQDTETGDVWSPYATDS